MPDSTHMVTPSPTYLPLPWLTAVGFFMQTLDGTILNTALPSMAEALGRALADAVRGHRLHADGGAAHPGLRLVGGQFGTRRVYLAAILLFTLAPWPVRSREHPARAGRCPGAVRWGRPADAHRAPGGAAGLQQARAAEGHVLRHHPSACRAPHRPGPGGLAGGGGELALGLPHQSAGGVIGFVASWHFMPELRQHTARFDWQGFALFSAGMVLVSVGLQGLGNTASPPVGPCSPCCSGWRHGELLALCRHRGAAALQPGAVQDLHLRHRHLGQPVRPPRQRCHALLTPLFLQLGLGSRRARRG